MRHDETHIAGATIGRNPPPAPWMGTDWSYFDGAPDDTPDWLRHPSPSGLQHATTYDPTGPHAGPDRDLIRALRAGFRA